MPATTSHSIFSPFSLRSVVYTLTTVVIFGALVLYLAFQARHIITGPVITLLAEPALSIDSPTITLHGSTENIVSLSLNGRTIYTNDAGIFTETLVLPRGYSILTLTATDRYGRVRSVERTYVRT